MPGWQYSFWGQGRAHAARTLTPWVWALGHVAATYVFDTSVSFISLQDVGEHDVQMLPLLEALLEAGYRPRTFQQVWTLNTAHGHPWRRRLGPFNPLDPVDGDTGLELEGLNRWDRWLV